MGRSRGAARKVVCPGQRACFGVGQGHREVGGAPGFAETSCGSDDLGVFGLTDQPDRVLQRVAMTRSREPVPTREASSLNVTSRTKWILSVGGTGTADITGEMFDSGCRTPRPVTPEAAAAD